MRCSLTFTVTEKKKKKKSKTHSGVRRRKYAYLRLIISPSLLSSLHEENHFHNHLLYSSPPPPSEQKKNLFKLHSATIRNYKLIILTSWFQFLEAIAIPFQHVLKTLFLLHLFASPSTYYTWGLLFVILRTKCDVSGHVEYSTVRILLRDQDFS